MNTALAAMKSKSINCSFSTDALLNHIDDTKLKQKRWRRVELYLGKNRFSNELHRSFNEFIAKVVITLGFLPLKVK